VTGASRFLIDWSQLTFTDVDGHRITAFLTGTPPGVIPYQTPIRCVNEDQEDSADDRTRRRAGRGAELTPL
jgi:hypothetical protein